MNTILKPSDIVVSGVRTSGKLTIGNYFGAISNFVKLQDTCDHIYCFLADLHTLTTHTNAEELKESTRLTLAIYLGCGLDSNKANIYVQSQLKEISELYLYFNMFAYKGELERTTTFKEKIEKHSDNINAGLLTYPVLMAADVLIHKGNFVPIGKDQTQHLEMMRNFGNRFNFKYNCSIFPEPQAFNNGEALLKVPSLGGSGKMDKSGPEEYAIFLTDSDKEIEKKIKRAVTDTGPTVPNSNKPESIQNLFDIMKLVSQSSVINHFEEKFNDCSIRYGDFKKQIADDMILFLKPIREKIDYYYNHEELLNEAADKGLEKAQQSASNTMKEVREVMGFSK